MKKAFRIWGKSVMFIIIGIIGLFLLTLLGLNIAKYFVYSEYYSIKTNICKNPGLNDGFVCQGIAVSEANEVILVCGYMKDKSNSRIYVTDFESNSYYVELTREGEKYTGHAGGLAITGDTVYIANAKKIFMESNGIQDSDILYIRNDAIAIIGNKFIGQLDITNLYA